MNYKKSKMNAFLKAYEDNNWNITLACKDININRTTYYNWLENCEKFKQKIQEQAESILDKAESVLHKELESNNVSIAQYILEKKGRKRGYGPQEMEHSGNLKLEIIKRSIHGKEDIEYND